MTSHLSLNSRLDFRMRSFLCVVNDFTSLDQRYLDRLTRSLQNSKKVFQEVIVVHNCKTVMERSVCMDARIDERTFRRPGWQNARALRKCYRVFSTQDHDIFQS